MTVDEQIAAFLAGERFAVVGASRDRAKYGNKVLRAYLQNDLDAVPVNPRSPEIEGLPAVVDLAALPHPVHGISVITPPQVTERVVQQAIDLGIRHVWMQPGAESSTSIELAEGHGINVIAGGPCLLVALGYRES